MPAACSIRRTGLLTPAAFERDFATAVYQTLARGGGLSVARFAFDPEHPRAQFDGARIISRLMRQMDFGAAAGRWLGHRGVRRDRFEDRAHDRAAAIERDAAHQPWQTRRARRTGRNRRNVAAERFGEIAAGAALPGFASRRFIDVPSSRNNGCSPALTIVNSALEDNMKKLALITASLAILATPVLARGSQDHWHRAGRSQIPDGLEGRDVLFEAEGPQRL